MKNISDVLEFYQSAGVDVFFDSVPNKFYIENIDEKNLLKNSIAVQKINAVENGKIYATDDAVNKAEYIAHSANDLENLQIKTEQSDFCPLKKYAINTVFGDGEFCNPDVMIIGEAPGVDEDKAGLPFVGVSGKLLDKIFESVGVSRTKNAYITNIVKWRPPGNRTPTREECMVCMPILWRQIALVRPKIIVLAGSVAAGAVLGITDGITSIRGKVFEYKIDDKNVVPVIPVFHPSYLLRTPSAKKFAYMDALSIINILKNS